MREIVLDTETTGLNPATGDRLVEIGCVEILHGVPTGKHYHVYINPERDVPPEVVAVHGLTTAFLRGKKVFAELVGEFLDFVADDPLVIHNAAFDMNFINHELGRLGFPAIPMSRVVDTLQMAREKFPGSPASLDALCKRFEIDNASRVLHGALLDAQLLAQCYVELTGGRQRGFDLVQELVVEDKAVTIEGPTPHVAILIPVEDIARRAHEALLDRLKEPLWRGALAG